MGTIRFILRLDKPLKNGTSPIDLLFQVSGQRKYYRTDVKLLPQTWDSENQKAIYLDRKQAKKELPNIEFDLLPSSNEIDEYNATLQNLASIIIRTQKRFMMDRVAYSAQMVLDKLKEETKKITKVEERSDVIFDFMQMYIDEHENIREKSSISVYKSVRNYLQEYCRTTGRKVTFENIDYSFFHSFQSFLLENKTDKNGKTIKGLNNTTVAKHLSTIKTFINYARKHGFETSMKYKDFKIKRETLEVIALTNEEFETLYNLDLSNNKRLAETRDVFCFACVTGLRYSDLSQLKTEHIKSDEIRLTIKKTKELLTIPFNSYSIALLNKYKGKAKPLPVISNQNLNYAVKDLCKLAGIDEEIEIVRFRGVKREAITYPKYELIGVHTGRKTFCTLSLEKGMSAEQVMSISGHRDYKSFKRYVKVTEQLKKVVMLQAWGPGEKENSLRAV